jgi:hypothetical protein
MAKSIHPARKGKVRKNKQADIKIIDAVYLRGYEILILFSNNRMKVVDFAPAIKKYAKGDYSIYAKEPVFKKFHIENGNIVWGKNWDLIFPVSDVFNAKF